MRLSDVKGEKTLDIMADAMELAAAIGDDERFAEFISALKAEVGDDGKVGDGAWRVFCKHVPPILRDKRYARGITSIMAAAAGVTYEEYAAEGPLLQDLFELLSSDAEALGFLIGSASRTGQAG